LVYIINKLKLTIIIENKMGYTEEYKQSLEYQEILRKNRERYKNMSPVDKINLISKMKKYGIGNEEKTKKYRKKHYEQNKEEMKERSKEYRKSHKEYYKKIGKTYWENNKETLNEKNKQRNRKNWKLRTLEEKERYRTHKNTYEKRKRVEDLQWAIKKRLRLRVWQAFRGIRKDSSDEMGINYNLIIEHLKKTTPSDYVVDPSKYAIDHIIPLCSFDLTNREEVKKAFAPENHQWLLFEENSRKVAEDIKYKKEKQKEALL
jgi:hypothetical protein